MGKRLFYFTQACKICKTISHRKWRETATADLMGNGRFAWPLLNLSPFPARYPAYGSCGTETVLIKKVSYKFNWVNASVQTMVRFCTSADYIDTTNSATSLSLILSQLRQGAVGLGRQN